MMIEKLPWQQPFIANISDTTAMLVTGRFEMGSWHLALALAYRLAAVPPSIEISDKGDVDIMVVAPEKNVIKVDAVRTSIDFLSYAAVARKKRAVVFLQAEKMNASAANALLKTLEEMQSNKMIILCARLTSELPATIISRCHIVHTPHLNEAEARKWFANGDNTLFHYQGKNPILSHSISSDWVTTLASIFSLGEKLDVSAAYHRIKEQSSALNLEPNDWLEGLQKWIVDIIFCAFETKPYFFVDYQDSLFNLGKGRKKIFLDFYQRLIFSRTLIHHPLVHGVYVREILYAYRQTCAH